MPFYVQRWNVRLDIKEKIFDMLNRFGLKDGIELLISESKKLTNNAQNYFDDITAIAVKWIE